jgi:solute:Na+ symporter, SSS family
MSWDLLIWAYLGVTLLIGLSAGRFVKNFTDFTFASGRLGKLMSTGTLMATQWGGVTFLGIAGFSYVAFYQGAWYALGPSVRFLFWAFLLAVVIRKVQPFTVSEWFALRYNSKCGVLATLLNAVAGIGMLGAQFVAFGAIASAFLGWDLTTAIVVGTVIVLAYTTVGGFVADATIDTVQMFVTIGGALFVLVAAMERFGSLNAVQSQVPEEYFNSFEPFGLLFMLTIFMLWLSDLPLQYNVQRMSAARNVRTAVFGATLAGLSYVVLFYVSPAIGAYARVAVPNLDNPDQAYPALVQAILPSGLAALIAAVLLAEILNTADSYTLGPSSVLSNDLYRVWRTNASRREVLVVSRITALAFGIVGLAAALVFQAIIDLILTFLVIGWAMLPAYFAATFWRGASANAAFVSMLAGAIVNGYLVTFPPGLFADQEPYFTGWIGFGLAIAILVIGSKLRPDKSGTAEAVPDSRALGFLPPQ